MHTNPGFRNPGAHPFGRPLLRKRYLKHKYKNTWATWGLGSDLCKWESLKLKLHKLYNKSLCDSNQFLWGWRTEVKTTKCWPCSHTLRQRLRIISRSCDSLCHTLTYLYVQYWVLYTWLLFQLSYKEWCILPQDLLWSGKETF